MSAHFQRHQQITDETQQRNTQQHHQQQQQQQQQSHEERAKKEGSHIRKAITSIEIRRSVWVFVAMKYNKR